MNIKIEIDCSPVEARTFLGLPDVSELNDHLTNEMKVRIDTNMAMLQPDELLKGWAALGGQAQEQFRKMMSVASEAALSRRGDKS